MSKAQYIMQLIGEGEHQQQDFKFAISDSKKIARTLVAFANTDGGRLLIGVKDNGKIAGVRSDEEFYMIEAAANMYCKPEVEVESVEHRVEGKIVLEIIVQPSKIPLHSAPNPDNKYLVYKRAADQNLVANYIYVEAIKKRRRNNGKPFKLSEPVSVLMDYLNENEEINFLGFRKLASLGTYATKRILIELVAMKILDMRFTEEDVFYSLSDESASATW